MLGICTKPEPVPNFQEITLGCDQPAETAQLFKQLFQEVSLTLGFVAVTSADKLPFKFTLRYRMFNFKEVRSPTLVLDSCAEGDYTNVFLMDQSPNVFERKFSSEANGFIDYLHSHELRVEMLDQGDMVKASFTVPLRKVIQSDTSSRRFEVNIFKTRINDKWAVEQTDEVLAKMVIQSTMGFVVKSAQNQSGDQHMKE